MNPAAGLGGLLIELFLGHLLIPVSRMGRRDVGALLEPRPLFKSVNPRLQGRELFQLEARPFLGGRKLEWIVSPYSSVGSLMLLLTGNRNPSPARDIRNADMVADNVSGTILLNLRLKHTI